MGDVRCWIAVNCGALKAAFAEGLERLTPSTSGNMDDLRGVFAYGLVLEGEISDLGDQISIDELTTEERRSILNHGTEAQKLCARIDEDTHRSHLSAEDAGALYRICREFLKCQLSFFRKIVWTRPSPNDQGGGLMTKLTWTTNRYSERQSPSETGSLDDSNIRAQVIYREDQIEIRVSGEKPPPCNPALVVKCNSWVSQAQAKSVAQALVDLLLESH